MSLPLDVMQQQWETRAAERVHKGQMAHTGPCRLCDKEENQVSEGDM